MKIANQITKNDARKLFDYRDGELFWLHAGSGRRSDLRASTRNGNQTEINIGGVRYQAKYLIWNWHHGITAASVVVANGDKSDLRIENLREIEKIISVRSPSTCPCCNQRVAAPSVEIIIDNCGVRPTEAKILRAVWRGNGHPVTTQRIFDVMYEDDPSGGPEPPMMYRAFKVALSRLRGRLKGSGVSIVNLGYGRGYRLKIGKEE